MPADCRLTVVDYGAMRLTAGQVQALRDQVDCILASPAFSGSERLRAFLRFIVEETLANRGDQIKEYTIGTRVYGKPPDYDPRLDSTVRTEAAKLRARLHQFYERSNDPNAVLITVPKGGYLPTIDFPCAAVQPELEAPTRQRPYRWLRPRAQHLLVVATGLLLVVAAVSWTRVSERAGTAKTLSRLTNSPGLNIDPALSPRGEFLVFASDRSGRGDLDLYVQPLQGSSVLRLTDDPANEYAPVLSPDSSRVVFRSDRNGGGLYVVPILGGQPRLLAPGGNRASFAPSGHMIAFDTTNGRSLPSAPGSSSIFILSEAGVVTNVRPDFAAAHSPLWTPDGQHLLFLGVRDQKQAEQQDLDWWVTPLNGGAAVRTGIAELLKRSDAPVRWDVPRGLRPLRFSPDGVDFLGPENQSVNVWRVRLTENTWKPAGAPQRVTMTTGSIASFSASGDGRVLAFSEIRTRTNIWALPLHTNSGTLAGKMQPITDSGGLNAWPSLESRGRFLYFLSDRTPHTNVWRKDLITGREDPITETQVGKTWPSVSVDGKELIFYAEKPVRWTAHRMDLLTGHITEICRQCIYFGKLRNGAELYDTPSAITPRPSAAPNRLLYRDALSGAERELMKGSRWIIRTPSLTKDQQWLAFAAHRLPAASRIAIAPFRGGNPPGQDGWVFVTDDGYRSFTPLWSPAETFLYYESDRDGHRCIWTQRLDPTTKRPVDEAVAVLHLHGVARLLGNTGQVYRGWALAQDKMVFPVVETFGDIWLLR